MIKDIKMWEEFEKDLISKTKPDHKANMMIFEQMYKHALYNMAVPPKNPIEGIEVKIKLARIITVFNQLIVKITEYSKPLVILADAGIQSK